MREKGVLKTKPFFSQKDPKSSVFILLWTNAVQIFTKFSSEIAFGVIYNIDPTASREKF